MANENYTALNATSNTKIFSADEISNALVPKAIHVDSSGNEVTKNNVPVAFTKIMQISHTYTIVKGNKNELKLRPEILNEHAEPSGEAMDVVDATTVVGQVFKASQDNINSINLTLQSAATFASLDAITAGGGENKAGTMEYGSDGALQAEYIKGGAAEAVRSAYTDDVGVTQDGSYACKMPMDTVTDEWRVTLTSTDLTGATFSLKYANTKGGNKAEMYFFVGDGTNTKSFPLSILSEKVWQTFTFLEEDMAVEATDDTATTPDMSAITKMGFRVDDADAGEFAYADSITYQAEGGSVIAELWDMGATLPASNGTLDYTTKDQYTELGDRGIGGVKSSVEIPLIGGKREYHLHDYVAGVALEDPANTPLTVDNYYAIVLKYVDTDVTVYGTDTTKGISYYTNGYAWKAETGDNLIDKIQGAAGSGVYSDLKFEIFSTQDVYVEEIELEADSPPNGNATVKVYIEDENRAIASMITTEQRGGFVERELSWDRKATPLLLPKGGKLEAYFNDGATDDVAKAKMTMCYYYEPSTPNG